jgi:uncharacterized protein (TIGR00251 family)
LSASDGPYPWRVEPQGLLVDVRVTPRASREGLDGIAIRDDGRPVLAVRVRAAPSDGQANAALIALVAKALHLPHGAVRIEAGATARRKTLRLDAEPAALAERLRVWLATCSGPAHKAPPA